jgi:hypothetical protein
MTKIEKSIGKVRNAIEEVCDRLELSNREVLSILEQITAETREVVEEDAGNRLSRKMGERKVKPTIEIEDWAIGSRGGEPYKAPEARSKVLYGHVLDHPTHGDLPHARTSAIVNIDLANRRVETQNSIYLLGKINLDYLVWAIRNSSSPTKDILCCIYAAEVDIPNYVEKN